MLNDKNKMLGQILQHVGEALDIPPSKYKQAVERYTAVGEWLKGGEYSDATDTPRIYPQGSFRLGTVIRPYRSGKDASYDIDLVCDITSSKDSSMPSKVKQEVGARLKEKKTYERMLDEEGRRCWTLDYADEEDGVGFHLDVLPAVPEGIFERNEIRKSGVSSELRQHSIAITDKVGFGRYNWDTSNPRGYGLWFDGKNKKMFDQVALMQKRSIFKSTSVFASVEQVPDSLVRTPLQRLVQILKRHRDVRFDKQPNASAKPISIIITTLAAEAYRNEADPWLALEALISAVDGYRHSNLIQERNGEWYIPNPTNPAENFADRWNRDNGQRAKAFFDWIGFLKTDLLEMKSISSLPALQSHLELLFGQTQVRSAFKNMGDQLRQDTVDGQLKMVAGSGMLTTSPKSSGIVVPRHNFYAD